MWLDAAATGLLQHVRHQQVSEAARMLAAVDEAPDCVAAIGVLLQVRAPGLLRARGPDAGRAAQSRTADRSARFLA
jgi:hypothetical protein